MMKTIVLASNNPKKIKELKALLPEIEIKSLAEIGCNEDIPETADSFEGNALLKAKYVVENYQRACFSDDSGLVVPALNGEPGIYSARYAGGEKSDAKNMDKLLSKLQKVEDRSAYFVTVICFHTGKEWHFFEGRIHGTIHHEKLGENGFGYDPIFIPEGENRTFAQMDAEEKNKNSHRSIAMGKLTQFLQSTMA